MVIGFILENGFRNQRVNTPMNGLFFERSEYRADGADERFKVRGGDNWREKG